MIPTRDDLELVFEQHSPGFVPLDLAAGGSGRRPGSDQHDRVQRNLVLVGDRLANRCEDRLAIERPQMGALHFLDDRNTPVGFVQSKDSPHSRGKTFVARPDREFDVLGIVVCTANDDQVLDPAGDV